MMPLLTVRRAAERKLESADLLLIAVFRRLPEGYRRRTQTDGGGGQEEPRHGRHDLAPGGARPGSLRPLAGGETDVRGRRRDRAAVGSARTGRLVRSGQQPCGKRFTGMRPPPGRAPPGRSSSEGAAKWTMPRRSRWPSQVICRDRGPSPRISRASSRRIRRCNSCICRRSGPCSH